MSPSVFKEVGSFCIITMVLKIWTAPPRDCRSLNGMLSSKCWRRLPLHPLYRDQYSEDNDSVMDDR